MFLLAIIQRADHGRGMDPQRERAQTHPLIYSLSSAAMASVVVRRQARRARCRPSILEAFETTEIDLS